MLVPPSVIRAPGRVHCRGQRLLDEVGLHVPHTTPAGAGPAQDARLGEQGPDTAPIPAQPPGPHRPAAPRVPVGPARERRHGNRPGRGPGGPTGPQPTGPGRTRGRRVEQAPAPKSRRRMQRGIAHYQFLDGDKVRLSTTRGHAIVASNPWELWHGLRACHTEAEIAAYARWQGETPEWEGLTELDDTTELPAMKPTVTVEQLAERERLKHAVSYSMHSVSRPDTALPTAWTPNPPDDQGESWTSPNGRVWRSKRVIERIKRKRAALGLATSYEELHGLDVPEPTVDLDGGAVAL